MKLETYLKKEGLLYGVSSKDCGNFKLKIFTDLKEAEAWLHTEEYDFRERELCSKTQAIKLMGKENFDHSFEMYANGDEDFM